MSVTSWAGGEKIGGLGHIFREPQKNHQQIEKLTSFECAWMLVKALCCTSEGNQIHWSNFRRARFGVCCPSVKTGVHPQCGLYWGALHLLISTNWVAKGPFISASTPLARQLLKQGFALIPTAGCAPPGWPFGAPTGTPKAPTDRDGTRTLESAWARITRAEPGLFPVAEGGAPSGSPTAGVRT